MCADDTYARAEAFARANIGKPWADSAAGPDAYDCWGLARAVQREVFGRELPIIGSAGVDREDVRAVMRAIENHPLRGEWEIVKRGGHGDLVTMAHHSHPSHIGIFIASDRGGVLHSVRPDGVRFDALAMLKMQGWSRIVFHRYRGEAQ